MGMRDGVDWATSTRPLIDFIEGKFTHNGRPVRVTMRANKISVGCSDVTPEALRKLLREYTLRYGCGEYVVQE